MGRTSVRTFSGSEVDLLHTDLASISIEDIAHHLSKLDRYNGAGAFPYSVGFHSLLVAESLPAELKLWGLLHDATEAYLGDVVSPLKALLPGFTEIKQVLLDEIAKLSLEFPEAQQALQQFVLAIETMKDCTPGYREIEQLLMGKIAERFRLGMPRPSIVKQADTAVMVAEMQQVMNWPDLAAAQHTSPAPVRIYERPWQDIRVEFLRRFIEYGGQV